MTDPIKWYRLLLKLYPARFREEFGGPLESQFRDEYGEVRGRFLFWIRTLFDLAVSIPAEFLGELRQDVRYSARVYSRRPVVTFLAVAALAMAIGATTGVFSVVNALLLRSLPFRDSDRLIAFSNFWLPDGGQPGFHQWRSHSSYLDDAAKYLSREMNVRRTSDTVRVNVAETSFNFFTLLGSEPEFGRGFAAGEDIPGHDGVAVIGFAFWQQFFGGDPRALGATIQINGAPMTIVGVARAGLDFPGRTAVWTPTAFDLDRIPKNTGSIFFNTIGRLKAGLNPVKVTSLMRAEVRQLHPDFDFDKNPGEYPTLIPLRERLAGPVEKAALALMGAVTFVLLIACANVANVLLARLAERKPELEVRAALGASRARLVQQLITESILLAAIGAAGGLFVAQWASKLAMSVQPAQLATQEYTILDWRVLVFTAGVAALTGILFGVFPAYLTSRLQPGGEMIHVHGGAQASGARKLRRVLIAMQVSLTVMLLAGSIVLGRGFLRLLGTDLGFRTQQVITMNVSLIGTRHESAASRRQYFDEALSRLRTIPGVESAGGVEYIPLGAFAFKPMVVLPFKLDSGGPSLGTVPITATPDYFRTMGIAVLAGREFTAQDRDGSEPVAVVNEELSRRAGQGVSLIGRKITSEMPKRTMTIVGVVKDVQYAGPVYGGNGFPMVFVPAAQTPRDFLTLVARVHSRPENYLPVARDAVQSVDREVAAFSVRTLDDYLAELLARPRFYTSVVLFLGGFALLLAMVGIYGVVSYSVAQRSHEIGVRMAVGASSRGVRFMILRESLTPVAVGMAAGTAGAIGLGQFLQHLVEKTQPIDIATCAAAALILAATAAAATWIATRRVVRMNPVEILRAE